jgi:hypothetical protein
MEESPGIPPAPRKLIMTWPNTGRIARKPGVSALAMLCAKAWVDLSWSDKRDNRI